MFVFSQIDLSYNNFSETSVPPTCTGNQYEHFPVLFKFNLALHGFCVLLSLQKLPNFFNPTIFSFHQKFFSELFWTGQLVSSYCRSISFFYSLSFCISLHFFLLLHQLRLLAECLKNNPCPKGNYITVESELRVYALNMFSASENSL